MSKRKSSPSVALPVAAGVVIVGALLWTFLLAPQEDSSPAARPAQTPAPETPAPTGNASPEETQQLTDLRAQHDPATALRMADEGHLQFAGGQLYPDREAIAIRSLVRLGQTEQAQARAERFLRRFPQHPQAELVRRMTKL